MPGGLARFGKIFCCDGERGKWPGRFDFIVTAISFTMGVLIVMRTPYIQYRNGGDVFLVPYMFFMVIFGLPLVFIEISLGQFTSSGVMTCWKFAPVIQGIGLSMVFLCAITSMTYSLICGILFYYMFASFTLPWSKCGQEWLDPHCNGETQNEPSMTECDPTTGVCWNTTRVDPLYIKPLTQHFFHRHVLQSVFSEGIDDLGSVVWHLALCSLLVWVLIAVCLCKSVRSYGKVAYFTAICPVCILVILFIHGLTLDGHDVGYKYFTFPDYRKLKVVRIWSDAAIEVFFGLKLAHGGLITLSSYNSFNSDTFRNSALLCVVQVVMTFLTGSLVFFYLGALAYARNYDINEVVDSGYTLVFSAIPETFLITGAPALWSFLWFLMLSSLCFGSLLGLVETVLTAIMDIIPNIRRYRPLVVIAVCSLIYLLGLPLTTQGGTYWTQFLDFGHFYWHLFLFPILELVALIFYGIPRFLNDVEIMVGRTTFWCIPVIVGKVIMGFFMFFPTLVGVVFINVMLRLLDNWTPDLPLWAIRLGRAMYWTPPVFIICGALFSIYQARTRLRGDWFAFLTPSPDWGPALPEHRAMMLRYVPWYKVPPTDGASCELQSTTTSM